ncbi:DAGL [Mytilus edulis]|uniref:sn-1-specific diacylglycerol lipase n=1 Tax=Mytilus edulis TaxID=6550 RepID=A0A8S3PY57_MYTED|nr:DAGL [Mytilus edulis]
MPGIVLFQRRWSFGSDDLVVPAVVLLFMHIAWEIVLAVILGVVDFEPAKTCSVGLVNLKNYLLGYLVMISVAIVIEVIIFWVSLRGTILHAEPRDCMQYLLYTKLVVLLFEFSWQIVGILWLVKHYQSCKSESPKKAALAIIVINWIVMLSIIISTWCTYDIAGRKWVKMKRFQESLKEKTKRNKRNSGRRNWRQRSSFLRLIFRYRDMERKAIRAYEESWDRRLQLLCCCVERKGRNRNSIAEIAKLLQEFFRDLDVVPSDVFAGIVLLRRHQKIRMRHVVSQSENDVYQYLSGVPIVPKTEFLQLSHPDVMDEYNKVVHYMRFALAAYGWPVFMMTNTGCGLCKITPQLRCCCSCCGLRHPKGVELIDDNSDLVYVTYHVDIGETPFYVALDHKHKKVIICIRGTLSLQDVLTDLKADAEILPLDPIKEDWVGHKGMVHAAVYIKKKIKEDMVLSQAFGKCSEIGAERYDLVLVGHSLGAGAAVILAILLQQEYPGLHCYAYSPPGGLLSETCVEQTKSFITSVVVGKDVVPRIGLFQMEVLRTDLINVIKMSNNSKWKIIMKGICCGSSETDKMNLEQVRNEIEERDLHAHPSDDDITLVAHTPLYPPGKIIHVVRSHPKNNGSSLCCGNNEPVYQAIWADNRSFDEVIVSPTMINDHMPDYVMDALEKVLVNVAPPKPIRTLTEDERQNLLNNRTPSVDSVLGLGQVDILIEPEIADQSLGHLPVYDMSNYHNENEYSLDAEGNIVITKNKPKMTLNLNENADAPLASPETLSDRSSLASSGSLKNIVSSNRDSLRKSLQSPLETIQQSPTVKSPNETSFDMPFIKQESKTSDNSDHVMTDQSDVTDSHVTERTDSTNTDDQLFDRHSPVESNYQVEYGSPNCFYSPAGLGYPHFIDDQEPEEMMSDSSETSEMNQLIEQESENIHLPLKVSHSECGKIQKKPLQCSQSDSYLQSLSDKYKMRRSKEQGDIAHLQDINNVFEDLIPIHDVNCNQPFICTHDQHNRSHGSISAEEDSDMRMSTTHVQRNGSHGSISAEEDSELRLSTSHSDDIFDMPIEETDV